MRDMDAGEVEIPKNPALPPVLQEEIPVHMARRSCQCLFCSSARALNKLEANGTRLARADSINDRPLHRRLVSQRALLVQAFLRQSFG